MLRAAFAKEGLANRAVADQVDGASSASARCAAASWLDALTGCRKLAGRGA